MRAATIATIAAASWMANAVHHRLPRRAATFAAASWTANAYVAAGDIAKFHWLGETGAKDILNTCPLI